MIHNLPPLLGLDGTVPRKITCLKALDKKILLVLGDLEKFNDGVEPSGGPRDDR